ncbi:MAG: flagellar motor protein MotB, partial [Bacteroidia bacterium]|nr:flagellar motor protein MotB [Bacteroidia bacterium]
MKTIRNILYFTFFFLHTSYISTAQSYDPSKINKKAVALYDQAMERLQDENYISATGLLLKCIETDKNYLPAYLSLGGVYGQLKNYKSSVEYYEKAFALDSNYTIEYKLPYSINLAGLGEFEKALAAINELLIKKPPKNPTTLKSSEYRKHCYEFAIDYANKNVNKNYVFVPQNMGDSINSAESEYFPSMTIDGNELVFTRRLNGRNEDFFYSHKTPDGWD